MITALSGVRRLVVRRKWVSGLVLVAVVGGAVAGVMLTTGSSNASAAVQTTTQLTTVASGTVKESVSATGTLTPADTEDVDFTSSALVTSVRVAVGDTVTKGQVLGTISTVGLKATLAQAEATLATAEATLTTDEASSTSTTAQIAADKAAITTDTQAVTDAKQAITDATLKSPIAGTVATVNVAKGDTSSGSSSSSGSAASGGSSTGTASGTGSSTSGSTSSSSSSAFVVVGMKSWTASLDVDDTEVGLISKGLQAQLTTDTSTSTLFGTVASVAVLSASSSGSATYPVTVTVTGTPTGLHDGESATVAIIYKQATGLTVPTLAIHTSAGSSYVYVSSNGKKVKQTVKTGLASGGTTIVTSGLTSGQQVYVDTITRTGGTGSTSTSSNRSTTGTTGGFGGTSGGGFPGGGFGGGAPGGGTTGGN